MSTGGSGVVPRGVSDGGATAERPVLGANGVTAGDGADAGPVPTAFVAVTVNV